MFGHTFECMCIIASAVCLLTCRFGSKAIVACCQLSCLQAGLLQSDRYCSCVSCDSAETSAALLILLLCRARNWRDVSCATTSVLQILLWLHTSCVSFVSAVQPMSNWVRLLCPTSSCCRFVRALMPCSWVKQLNDKFNLTRDVTETSCCNVAKFCDKTQRKDVTQQG